MAREWARDKPERNETIQRQNQPTGRGVSVPYTSAPATMKRGTGSFVNSDGINKPADPTASTQAPSQYSRS